MEVRSRAVPTLPDVEVTLSGLCAAKVKVKVTGDAVIELKLLSDPFVAEKIQVPALVAVKTPPLKLQPDAVPPL